MGLSNKGNRIMFEGFIKIDNLLENFKLTDFEMNKILYLLNFLIISEGVNVNDNVLIAGGYADSIIRKHLLKINSELIPHFPNDLDFFLIKDNKPYLPFSFDDSFHCINNLIKVLDNKIYYNNFSSFRECYYDFYENAAYVTNGYLEGIKNKKIYPPYWYDDFTVRDFLKKGDNLFKPFVVAHKYGLNFDDKYILFWNELFNYMLENNMDGVCASYTNNIKYLKLIREQVILFDSKWKKVFDSLKQINNISTRILLREMTDHDQDKL
jgi:hypothetical protein